jgi:hypothetical protein
MQKGLCGPQIRSESCTIFIVLHPVAYKYGYTNNGTYICRPRNNLLIHTTRFDSNGSSSGDFHYTLLVIELRGNIIICTITYIDHNPSLSFFLYNFGDVTQ